MGRVVVVQDNLKKIDELFELREDERYAGGYTYFCRECGIEANVGEAVFECQCGKILPTYIICRYGCGAKWQLKISVEEHSLMKH